MANDDFDLKISPKDKYQPEGFDQVRYDELHPKILQAIGNLHCTLPQIKRSAGIPVAEDISLIIGTMEEKGEIIRLSNGVQTAFFRNEKGKIPTRFWLAGNNKVEVSFEKTVEPVIPKPIEHPREGIFIEPIEPSFFKPRQWTADFIKEIAGLGLSLVETARKIGVPASELKQNLRLPAFQSIWDETRRNIFAQKQEEQSPDKQTKETIMPRNKISKITPELMEQLAFEGKTRQEAAIACEVTLNGLNGTFSKYPKNREAWKRGEERRRKEIGEQAPKPARQRKVKPVIENPEIITEPRFEQTVKHLSENGRSKEGFEKVRQELAKTEPQIEVMPPESDILLKRIEVDLLYALVYQKPSPMTEETLRLLREKV